MRISRPRGHPTRRGLLLAAAVILATVVLAVGISVGRHLDGLRKPSSAEDPGAPAQNSPPASQTSLSASFDALRATLAGDVGVALVGIGTPDQPLALGGWTEGPAWSTIKVPLAIAAVRDSGATESDAAIVAAITRSDNRAAESLWAQLGDPQTAADKVGAVLRETGDPTVVQSEKVRPEFTAFGQTIWRLDDQLRFMAVAHCDPRNAPVLDLMRQVSADQRWGLGQLADAEYKGGWGPSPEGAYLVRQFGVITTNRGSTAVALAVSPASGDLADGEAALTAIANWLGAQSDQLPAGSCPGQ